MDVGGYSKLASAIEEVPRGMSEGITSSSSVSPNVRGRGAPVYGQDCRMAIHCTLGEDSRGPKRLGKATLESSPGSLVGGQLLFQT